MTISIRVPATLSNLGPGFDVLGFAVSLHNTFHIERAELGRFVDDGKEIEAGEHLVFHTAARAAAHFGVPLPCGMSLRQEEVLPRGRGLGSSATARVAGFLAWCQLTGARPSQDAALAFLSDEEGHPDNAVAALLGGVTLAAATDEGLYTVRLPPRAGWRIVLCIPDKEISTDAAREVLPDGYSRSDVVHNSARLAMLMHGLTSGDETSLRHGVVDRVHHPYRGPLIGPVDDAIAAAQRAGATCAFISGSGSTLAALVTRDDVDVDKVAEAFAGVIRDAGVPARTMCVVPEHLGAWEDTLGDA